MKNSSAEMVPQPPLSPPPPPAALPAASSAVSVPATPTTSSKDTTAWRYHQRSRQHPQRHPDGRPARPTPPGLAGNARAPAVRALRRAAALRVSVRRLIVVFGIVQATSLSYPLRLYMLCPPSCAFRRCARCGHTRFKTRGGSERISARRLIVVFMIMRAPSLSYPLRL